MTLKHLDKNLIYVNRLKNICQTSDDACFVCIYDYHQSTTINLLNLFYKGHEFWHMFMEPDDRHCKTLIYLSFIENNL